MVNNFSQIKSILKFEEDYFYFIQIIQRKKEIPELGSNNRVIRSYMISSLEKLEKNEAEIIKMCEMFNARAYIHLNRRKWSRIALECLRHNAELIANGQHDGIKASLETVIGRYNCEPKGEKTWIIDIDWVDYENDKAAIPKIATLISKLQLETGIEPMIEYIPTKNGCHIITKPFNTAEFAKYMQLQGSTPDIHKDNPTVLLIP
jgi:hypothetical protein